MKPASKILNFASKPPPYDADGNATLVKISTGTWNVNYNGASRHVCFTRNNADGSQTVVSKAFDFKGRRIWQKIETVVIDGDNAETRTVVSHQRFIYRGFLQIASLDLTRENLVAKHCILWDPTQPTGTRPLAIQTAGSWFVYGHDLTKNVMEIFGQTGYIRSVYSYNPFGNATASSDISQHFQFSSEFYDSELELVYYNFRHYSPTLGRWLSHDPIEEQGSLNLYAF